MSSLTPPGKVSPLIKGARWTFLLAGIAYGSARYSTLSRREKKRLDELERTRPEREEKMKAEKLKKAQEEVMDLNKNLGI